MSFARVSERFRSVLVLAALAGMANVFAFAPFGLFFIPVLSLALLFRLVDGAEPWRAAWTGFVFGAAWFAAGNYWIFISLHVFGKAPIILAALVMLLMFAIMGAYYALFGWLSARFSPRNEAFRHLVWLPALWVALEWIRGWFLSGYPWFSLGYSQTETALAGFGPVAGVFGVSLVVAMLAGCLALLSRGVVRPASAFAIALAGLLTIGAFALDRVSWTRPTGERLSVALVQGNVAQDEKWLTTQRVPTMLKYWSLTEEHADADLIVWPEAAIPALYYQLDTGFYAQLEDELLRGEGRLLTGTLVHDLAEDVYYNSAVVLGADERRFYHKRHLVPFGEYFPVPDFVRNWLRLMNLPYSDFETGRDGSALEIAPGLAAAIMICYEAVFGEEVITALPEAHLLVNISNDGWFGRSIGPLQHFQIARMRAIETGRWLIRGTNTGVTAIVDHHGRVRASVPQFETTVLRGDVELREGATPYVRFGNWPVVIAAFFLLAIGFASRKWSAR